MAQNTFDCGAGRRLHGRRAGGLACRRRPYGRRYGFRCFLALFGLPGWGAASRAGRQGQGPRLPGGLRRVLLRRTRRASLGRRGGGVLCAGCRRLDRRRSHQHGDSSFQPRSGSSLSCPAAWLTFQPRRNHSNPLPIGRYQARSNPMHSSTFWTKAGAAAALFALSLFQFSVSQLHAEDYKVGSIQITQPWARATPKGASAGAAYMTVTNSGTTAQHLNCVSSDVATECQIHEMSMDGGVMKMRPLQGGLQVKPGETVTLKPGSFHLMLVGLKQPLLPGTSDRK